jgi:histidinol-phosphatase
LVAEGAADVMVEIGPTLWDLAAPALIVEEAGGRVTDFNGRPSYAGPQALATNRLVERAVISILAGR